MLKSINFKKVGAILIIVAILVLMFILNVKNENFWSLDFYEIIYLSILIFISFFLTQHYTDERKRKDFVLDIIDKLYNLILLISLDKIIEDKNKDYFNMSVRNIRNVLDLLSSIAIKYGIENDIYYLCDEIKEIDATVSENSSNIDTLVALNKTIDRHKDNMLYKCDAIKLKLMFPIKKK